ncbi:hypothetical protein BCR44DRAFT_1256194 [Catenaria anguillulae PL171]|uniref:Uncharacterized protein n=1 Tax=Catenaria anguillulae PL171 TaxID=765915 RepID=A0A1Y2HBP8_9FUNG|nr:hypothetical protein BCR44DRAFT_1256194 [Catenaria anguillulae PL171]
MAAFPVSQVVEECVPFLYQANVHQRLRHLLPVGQAAQHQATKQAKTVSWLPQSMHPSSLSLPRPGHRPPVMSRTPWLVVVPRCCVATLGKTWEVFAPNPFPVPELDYPH